MQIGNNAPTATPTTPINIIKKQLHIIFIIPTTGYNLASKPCLPIAVRYLVENGLMNGNK